MLTRCVVRAVVGDRTIEIHPAEGERLLDALRDTGLPAVCGGNGVCGKCRVRVLSGSVDISATDAAYFSPEQLEAGYRLACTAYPRENLTVEIPAGEESLSTITTYREGENACDTVRVELLEELKTRKSVVGRICRMNPDTQVTMDLLGKCAALLDSGAQSGHVHWVEDRVALIAARPTTLYGVGVDIGTTTLGFGLVDLNTGRLLDRHSEINRQREYGADVISRIMQSHEGQLSHFSEMIRAQIAHGVEALCAANGVDHGHLARICIAGNTTMLHLLLQLSCRTLGNYPFTPVTLEGLTLEYGELFAGEFSCGVELLPGVSTYVGADITAGILETELHRGSRPALLVDIGTNGEMAIGHGGSLLCTSTAAGPAFEGGNIRCGTGSVPGAISAVEYRDGVFLPTTIGDRPPAGICGSGVIDVVYKLLRAGILKGNGRLDPAHKQEGVLLATTARGEEIRFVQKDVREVQMGKSAIRTGIDTLIREAGLCYDDVQTVYIAGGFGYHIDFDSAVGIGLVPAALRDKLVPIGNSSLGGAVKLLLNRRCRELLREMEGIASEFSLSEDKEFNRLFVDNMVLERY